MSAEARVIECALVWQEACDLLVLAAPLPQEDPIAQQMIRRTTDAHMALLHAVRALREVVGE